MNEQELRAEFKREFLLEFPALVKNGYSDSIFRRFDETRDSEYMDDGVWAVYQMYKRTKLQSEQRIAELEADLSDLRYINREKENQLIDAGFKFSQLKAENERLNAALTRYEASRVTCQTYRHSIDSPCAECNVAEFSKPQKDE